MNRQWIRHLVRRRIKKAHARFARRALAAPVLVPPEGQALHRERAPIRSPKPQGAETVGVYLFGGFPSLC